MPSHMRRGIANIFWSLRPNSHRQVLYGKRKGEIGKTFGRCVNGREWQIIEENARPDHIRMLVGMPPKHSVSEWMGYLKGKSSLMIVDQTCE